MKIAFLILLFSMKPGVFIEDFTKIDAWEMKRLARRPNHFSIVKENGNPVLKVQSSSSASGIFRKWKVEPLTTGTVSWKWKVNTSLANNDKERTKAGDDYAARVFLLFEPHFFRWRIPNICYVWAGNERLGSIYKSPHTSKVCTIVLQQGNKHSMQWLEEERDFVADYKSCFGKTPQSLSAIAIMVDTDDTNGKITAWFDDLRISTNL